MYLSVVQTIAGAPVSSRLDYCHSIIHNVASKGIAKFQYVHNCLPIVLKQSPLFSCSVPLLRSLHWLPVRFCIMFKIYTIAHQTLLSKQPPYLLLMLTPARNTDSSGRQAQMYLLFPQSRQRPEHELSQLLRLLCGIHFLTTLNQQKTLLHFAVT